MKENITKKKYDINIRWLNDFDRFVDDGMNSTIYSYLSRTYDFMEIQLAFKTALSTVAFYLNSSHPELDKDNGSEEYIINQLDTWNLISKVKVDIKQFLNKIKIIAYLYYEKIPSNRLTTYHRIHRKHLRKTFENIIDNEISDVLYYEWSEADFETYFQLADHKAEESDINLLKDISRQNTIGDLVSHFSIENISRDRLEVYYKELFNVYSRLVVEYEQLKNENIKIKEEVLSLKREVNNRTPIKKQSKAERRPANELLSKLFCCTLFESTEATRLLRSIVHDKVKGEVCGRAEHNCENWTWAHVRRAMVRSGFFGIKPENKTQEAWENEAISDTDFGKVINSCDATITPGSVKTSCDRGKKKRGICDENIVKRICEYLEPIAIIINK